MRKHTWGSFIFMLRSIFVILELWCITCTLLCHNSHIGRLSDDAHDFNWDIILWKCRNLCSIYLYSVIIFFVVFFEPAEGFINNLATHTEDGSYPVPRQIPKTNKGHRNQWCKDWRWSRHEISGNHRGNTSHIKVISANSAPHPPLQSGWVISCSPFWEQLENIHPGV